MKLEMDAIGKAKCYIARIRGLSKSYGFDREFLKPTTRKPCAVPDQRQSFDLSDGIYEIQEGTTRTYIAVVDDHRIPIETRDIEAARDACKRCDYDLSRVFDQWACSPKCSSATLAGIAQQATSEKVADAQNRSKNRQAWETRQRKARISLMSARMAFDGSDPVETRAFLKKLEQLGAAGALAADLFRCQKSSTRAKVYPDKYRVKAYSRKGDVIERLCKTLAASSLPWGWKKDSSQNYAEWVLYVDLSEGQVSFHSPDRWEGPDYEGEWDLQRESESRILSYCDSILSNCSAASTQT